MLLSASYGFYATFQANYLLAVLLVVTGISYVCGLRIAAQNQEAKRKQWLWTGVIACVAILALLKYLPFLASETRTICGLDGRLSPILISIGVSYYSFQAISYLIDIYLEIEEPQQHFGYFALYMAFFPKLLQGPIERVGDLLPQLKKPYQFNYDAMRSGLLLFTWGLFKKVVVADRLTLYADQVYGNVHNYSGLALVIGTYAYAFQIYFDFSGYTDMARGTGRLFGIDLTKNFNSPYLATSLPDFWRRWHISFSRWILDYIFKPLQMRWRNRGRTGTASALVITFLISGVWHGATWGFLLWGLLHGVYLASSTLSRPYQKKLYTWMGLEKSPWLKMWQVFSTFNLVCFAWVFFRAKALGDAQYVLGHLVGGNRGLATIFSSRGPLENCILLTVLLTVLVVAVVKTKFTNIDLLHVKSPVVRWSVYVSLPFSILLFYVDSSNSFLYFNF